MSLLSSFHHSKELGNNEPLKSKKDNDRIAPFNLNMVTPTNETATGCEDLLSGSGGAIIIVKTEPKLVPTQSVGLITFGSENHYDKIRSIFFTSFSYLSS